MSSGPGYGIAGHKQQYSSGVRCGNWVEDLKGAKLAANAKHVPFASETETNMHFADPSTKESKDKSDGTFKKPSMTGLPLTLLMNHCGKGNLHQDTQVAARYQTTNRNSCISTKGLPVGKSSSLARKIAIKSDRQSSIYSTSQKTASAVPYVAIARKASGTEPQKRHVSSQSFTKSFNKGAMPGLR